MWSPIIESTRPSDTNLKIGTDGIVSVSFSPSKGQQILSVGTSGGRVRIFDCSQKTCKVLYKKKWHKSIRCLTFSDFAPNICISASAQCCLKVHDINTEQRIAYFKRTDKSSPYSALLPIADHRWVTGHDDGCVKFWDDRQKDGLVCTIEPDFEDKGKDDMLAINEFAFGTDPQGLFLAAVDNGCLVTFNVRRRRRELVSEPLGYSARSVVAVKHGRKVLVGTDEGVVLTYNWSEFGSVCDRFPVRTKRCRVGTNSVRTSGETGLPAVEKMIKITEDVVVIATDDGALSAMSILPNRMLSTLGWHTATESGLGGDCMTLAIAPDGDLMATGLPLASTLRFWSVGQLEAEAEAEAEALSVPSRGKRRNGAPGGSNKSAKARTTSRSMDAQRSEFLSGLMSPSRDTGSCSDSSESE